MPDKDAIENPAGRSAYDAGLVVEGLTVVDDLAGWHRSGTLNAAAPGPELRPQS